MTFHNANIRFKLVPKPLPRLKLEKAHLPDELTLKVTEADLDNLTEEGRLALKDGFIKMGDVRKLTIG